MITVGAFGFKWSIHPQGNLIFRDVTRDWSGNVRNTREKGANGKKEKRGELYFHRRLSGLKN
tara:strand:- start:53 stop:238 length:186 start_codon:yes stop_codon:yes gene_type:complete